jgi:hypothetical protein
MRQSFEGFPTIALPSPRIVLARERVFHNANKSLLSTATLAPLVSLPPIRGVWEVLAGGLANPKASACSIDLLALAGLSSAQVVGRAKLATDVLDNDGLTNDAIAANTPVVFRMLFWPSVDDRLNCLGESLGGIVTLPVNGAFLSTAVRVNIVSTADVVDGPIDLALLSITATSAAFTLDWLRVLAYPGADEMVS